MTVPKSFLLGGLKWRVVYVDALPERDGSYTYGECSSITRTITIARNVNGTPVSASEQLQTFVHEFVHACLITTGYHDLNSSEPFVTAMELMVMEYLRSRK